MPASAFWMSMGLGMPTAYPRPASGKRGYGRGVDAATLVGLLADPTRLKVVAALALGAGTLEEVAAAAPPPPPRGAAGGGGRPARAAARPARPPPAGPAPPPRGGGAPARAQPS